MRSRLATLLTSLVLVGGAGGALAISNSDHHADSHGGAAGDQYRPGKGCGDKNHTHNKHGQCVKAAHKTKKHHKKKHHKNARKHHKKKHHKNARKHHKNAGHTRKGSYHCSYRQVGQNLVGACRYY